MLFSIMVVGLKAMRRLVWDERSELMIGTLATVIVVGVHIAFEWLFITNYVHYLLAMNVGALVGITATPPATLGGVARETAADRRPRLSDRLT